MAALWIFKNNIPNIPDGLVLDFEIFVGREKEFYIFPNCQGHIGGCEKIFKKNNIPNILNIPDDLVLDFCCR